jgi:hypothetical protein
LFPLRLVPLEDSERSPLAACHGGALRHDPDLPQVQASGSA